MSGIWSLVFSLITTLSVISIKLGFISGAAFAFANCACLALCSFA